MFRIIDFQIHHKFTGADFELESLLTFSVPPEEQKLPIPFTAREDDIAESVERFNIFLSVPIGGDWLVGDIQNTNVFFSDNDGKN